MTYDGSQPLTTSEGVLPFAVQSPPPPPPVHHKKVVPVHHKKASPASSAASSAAASAAGAPSNMHTLLVTAAFAIPVHRKQVYLASSATGAFVRCQYICLRRSASERYQLLLSAFALRRCTRRKSSPPCPPPPPRTLLVRLELPPDEKKTQRNMSIVSCLTRTLTGSAPAARREELQQLQPLRWGLQRSLRRPLQCCHSIHDSVIF